MNGPGSFCMHDIAPSNLIDLLYCSFSTRTTAGAGDIVPFTRPARIAATLDAMAGIDFEAILAVRLYRPPRVDGLQVQSF